MGLFALEHSKLAYQVACALYGSAIVLVAAFLVAAGSSEQWSEILALALAGIASWTGIEYALHRCVPHGLQPLRRWNSLHHQRPMALIFTPTIMSEILFALLVSLPALVLGGLLRSCALTISMLIGYLAYTSTHHAIHHWRIDDVWLKRRKRWRALYHGSIEHLGCYGVSSSFWDQVFGSTPREIMTVVVEKR
ncbi:MAG: sterol desaturase/sphingolipid hydroxylase (fatty acid hydroxylase superfamily) [Gammaproteobacteria bacterium]|jgi:sterol desaturase/sphingolipid hydroxylase (fatty acid hydroxylase superfamily)